MSQGPNRPLGAAVVHRLRRPGRVGPAVGESARKPGGLGARSVRFAQALRPRSLPHAESAGAGPIPGRMLAGAVRTEVPVHRLGPVQAAGTMVVPRDLMPLQLPIATLSTPSTPSTPSPIASPVPDPVAPRSQR
jgi:hypothetical protein